MAEVVDIGNGDCDVAKNKGNYDTRNLFSWWL